MEEKAFAEKEVKAIIRKAFQAGSDWRKNSDEESWAPDFYTATKDTIKHLVEEAIPVDICKTDCEFYEGCLEKFACETQVRAQK
jgi:hypothetical protein